MPGIQKTLPNGQWSCNGERPNPRRRILVVDDEPDIRRINAMMLDRAGYRVDTAEDGVFAWEALGASRYDLMITDNSMPNLTGLQLLRRLYAAHRELPFIMATGKIPEEEYTKYPWLQSAATLLKPYTGEELLEVVSIVLRKADGATVGSKAPRGHDLKNVRFPQTGELASAPFQRRMQPPHRILVVEDEPDLRQLNFEVLESSGYHVDTAEDGLAGWKALHATRHAPESYALLITDHDMPGLSGLALVKKARAARMALPVIMATGRLLPEDLFARYDWLQPVAALIKPYSIEQLLGTVEAVLRTADGSRAEISPPPNGPSDGGLRFG
ncbi:MAG TPA: response regulator [Verrucomicrobiae bacterium]|nr:response regulator [Verrucomicrobiae bacterium]